MPREKRGFLMYLSFKVYQLFERLYILWLQAKYSYVKKEKNQKIS